MCRTEQQHDSRFGIGFGIHAPKLLFRQQVSLHRRYSPMRAFIALRELVMQGFS